MRIPSVLLTLSALIACGEEGSDGTAVDAEALSAQIAALQAALDEQSARSDRLEETVAEQQEIISALDAELAELGDGLGSTDGLVDAIDANTAAIDALGETALTTEALDKAQRKPVLALAWAPAQNARSLFAAAHVIVIKRCHPAQRSKLAS